MYWCLVMSWEDWMLMINFQFIFPETNESEIEFERIGFSWVANADMRWFKLVHRIKELIEWLNTNPVYNPGSVQPSRRRGTSQWIRYDPRNHHHHPKKPPLVNLSAQMEVSMSLNALTRLPLKNTGRLEEFGLARHSLFTSRTSCLETAQRRRKVLVVEAKGKKGMAARQYQRTPPPMPKIEDDGNPRFVIFIRMANVRLFLSIIIFLVTYSKSCCVISVSWNMKQVYLWYPLSIIAGGTTAKIMVAAKDNLLGKYIYKDTIARNIAAVIYRVSKTSCLLSSCLVWFCFVICVSFWLFSSSTGWEGDTKDSN